MYSLVPRHASALGLHCSEDVATTCKCSSTYRGHRTRNVHCRSASDFALAKEKIESRHSKRSGLLGQVRTVATPRLTPEKVFERLFDTVHPVAEQHYAAYYSSQLGGIVTEPAVMVLQIDDHMVHRGHGVFDTASIVDGYIYQLDAHLERFLDSAARAKIPLLSKTADVKRIILDTAAASRLTNGSIKFWLSPGRGGFALSPSECTESILYVVVTSQEAQPDIENGMKCCVSKLPSKPALMATLKSTNYLHNALALLEAQEEGYDTAIFADEEGYLLEAPTMNLGIVTPDLKLVFPPFERCLAGITAQRLMKLVEENKVDPGQQMLTGVERRRIHADEILTAQEAFLCSSTMQVVGITQWGEQVLHLLTGYDGKTGPIVTYLNGLITYDSRPRPDSDVHTPVPYGYLSGMREQLT